MLGDAEQSTITMPTTEGTSSRSKHLLPPEPFTDRRHHRCINRRIAAAH